MNATHDEQLENEMREFMRRALRVAKDTGDLSPEFETAKEARHRQNPHREVTFPQKRPKRPALETDKR